MEKDGEYYFGRWFNEALEVVDKCFSEGNYKFSDVLDEYSDYELDDQTFVTALKAAYLAFLADLPEDKLKLTDDISTVRKYEAPIDDDYVHEDELPRLNNYLAVDEYVRDKVKEVIIELVDNEDLLKHTKLSSEEVELLNQIIESENSESILPDFSITVSNRNNYAILSFKDGVIYNLLEKSTGKITEYRKEIISLESGGFEIGEYGSDSFTNVFFQSNMSLNDPFFNLDYSLIDRWCFDFLDSCYGKIEIHISE